MPIKSVTIPWSLLQRQVDRLLPVTHESPVASATVDQVTLRPVGGSDRMAITARGRAKMVVTLPIGIDATAKPAIMDGRLRLQEIAVTEITCGPARIGLTAETSKSTWLTAIADAACRRLETMEYDLRDQPGLLSAVARNAVSSWESTEEGVKVGFHPEAARRLSYAFTAMAVTAVALALCALFVWG